MIRILQQDNIVTKTIFALIIGATIVLMVIFLVPGIFETSGANDATVYATVHAPGPLGRVFGDTQTVNAADVSRIVQAQLRQQGIPDNPMYEQLLAPRVQQSLVGQKVLIVEADRLGLKPSDADLVAWLKKSQFAEELFPDGKPIAYDKYVDFVQNYFGRSVADFESELKNEIELQRLEAMITGGITVSYDAAKQQYMTDGTKVNFDYAVISLDDVKKSINPSDADLQAWFKQNTGRYASAVPEQRKIQFIAFDSSNLPGGAPQVSDGQVNSYYAAHQEQYKTQEQVQTRHILITVPEGADAKTDAAAKAKAEDVLKQLKGGAKFADLASKYSDDPGSKTQGGELPMMQTAQLDPAYGKAAMALNPGQTSDLVRSKFGYHIIQTENKIPAGVKPLADVKPEIVKILTAQQSGKALQDFANQLTDEAKKNGMAAAAAAHHLQVETTDFIGRNGTIGSLPDATNVLSGAFGAPKDSAPAAASTGEGYAVYKVLDVKAAHAPEFADYKSHILDDYRTDKAPVLLNQKLAELSSRAKALNDLKKAAAEAKVPVKNSGLVAKDGQVPDLGSLSGPGAAIFALTKGGISGPINEGANGAVAQLIDKQEPSADDVAKNVPATLDKLKQQAQSQAFNVFAGELVEKYEKAGAIVYSKRQAAPASPFGK